MSNSSDTAGHMLPSFISQGEATPPPSQLKAANQEIENTCDTGDTGYMEGDYSDDEMEDKKITKASQQYLLRTEQHRNHHKMAERKRRQEMKQLFEELRAALPSNAQRASKWELLDQAIQYIDHLATKHISLNRRKVELITDIRKLRGMDPQN